MPWHDVVIVGAGIVGCLVAREVASHWPGWSILLVDRDMAGSGASRCSAGLHLPMGGTDRLRRMAAYGQDYYQKLLHETPSLPIYPLDVAVVAAPDRAADLRVGYLPSAGLTRAPNGFAGPIATPPDAEVWRVDGGQYADVYALVQALVLQLRQVLTVREGVAVAAVEPTDDGAVVRLGTGEVVNASQVVLAPGPWPHDPAWQTLVAPLGLRVKKVMALHIEQAPAATDPVILFHDDDNAYLLPVRHRGHWLFSFTCSGWDPEPDALHAGIDAGNLADARAILHRYAPDLAQRASAGRVFADSYSPNREPVLRALDANGHVTFAGAANGSGYRFAPAIAAEAVDLLRLDVQRIHERRHE